MFAPKRHARLIHSASLGVELWNPDSLFGLDHVSGKKQFGCCFFLPVHSIGSETEFADGTCSFCEFADGKRFRCFARPFWLPLGNPLKDAVQASGFCVVVFVRGLGFRALGILGSLLKSMIFVG